MNGQNLGKAFLFPNVENEMVFGFKPRYFLSNVNWRIGPPLDIAVQQRLLELLLVIQQMRDQELLVTGVIVIDIGSFAPWLDNTPKQVSSAMKYFIAGLKELENIEL